MNTIWYEKEPLFTENKNCPICGKDLSTCISMQLIGVSIFSKIFTCSTEHKKEFIRQIWKLSKQKDNKDSTNET